jgi:N-acetylmuramic acid 6-phosphate etherase
VKTALVMLKRGIGADEARRLLDGVDGSVSRALAA